MNGAQALLETLVEAGVEICFANPGTSDACCNLSKLSKKDPALTHVSLSASRNEEEISETAVPYPLGSSNNSCWTGKSNAPARVANSEGCEVLVFPFVSEGISPANLNMHLLGSLKTLPCVNSYVSFNYGKSSSDVTFYLPSTIVWFDCGSRNPSPPFLGGKSS